MKPGVLQSVGWQRVRHNLVTEQPQEVGSLCPQTSMTWVWPPVLCQLWQHEFLPTHPMGPWGCGLQAPALGFSSIGTHKPRWRAEHSKRVHMWAAVCMDIHVCMHEHTWRGIHVWEHVYINRRAHSLTKLTLTEHMLGLPALLQTGDREMLFVLSHSVVSDSGTPWLAARQAPLSVGFPRQEYQSGLPFPPSGDLPDPGIEPTSPESPALAGGFFTPEPPGKSRDRWTRVQTEVHMKTLSSCRPTAPSPPSPNLSLTG